MLCEHWNPLGRCTRCEFKPPKEMKGCRCGRFIFKDQRVCSPCFQVEDSLYTNQERYDHRHVMRAVIRNLNA